jgi:hypothetical protein
MVDCVNAESMAPPKVPPMATLSIKKKSLSKGKELVLATE